MPYEWTIRAPVQAGAFCFATGDAPAAVLHLWPYRSLPKRGFVWFIGLTSGMIALPLLAVLGSMVLWALLPFLAAAVAGVWWALARSYRDGEMLEELTLWSDRVSLVQTAPGGGRKEWEANPYWVEVRLAARGGPVEQYLTLKGGAREVELGAFLAPEERLALAGEVQAALAGLHLP